MLRIILFTMAGGLLPALTLADTVYVNDSLRVGVRTEPSNSVTPHGVVITGMQLEVLDRSDGYVKIRNESGVEGWIKDIYITKEKPAQLELTRLTAEHAKLQSLLATQGDELKVSRAKTVAMTEELHTLKTRNTELHSQLAQSNSGEYARVTLHYLGYLIAVLVIAGGGFVSGVFWHRRQAMRRLGGLRV